MGDQIRKLYRLGKNYVTKHTTEIEAAYHMGSYGSCVVPMNF